MGEKTESKYASELFEVFRLFDRIGRSFYGLLLLQIAWLLTLGLAANLAEEKVESPSLIIPIPTKDVPHFYFQEVPITAIAVVGGIFIFIGWLFYSRLHHYVIKPFILVGNLILKVVAFILLCFFIVLNIPLLLITVPLAILLAIMRRSKWKEEFKRKNPKKDLETEYPKWQKEKKDDIKFFININAFRAYFSFLTRLINPGRIGIAPLSTYTYVEDFQAQKIQLQMFAVAIAKLHAVLQNFEPIKHLRFYILPIHPKITSNKEASFFCSLFGLNALLWGSYYDSKGEIIWLNVHQAFKGKKDEYDLNPIDGIFPDEVKIDMAVVTFSRRDYTEAYIVLVIVLAQVLRSRKKIRREKKGLFSLFNPYAILWDKLYSISDQAIESIFSNLVFDLSQSFSNESISEEFLSSGKGWLFEIVGKWIGHQIKMDIWDNHWKEIGKEKYAERLYIIASECARWKPHCWENFYRLGAIACILNDKEKALMNFKLARKVDEHTAPASINYAMARAQVELKSSGSLPDDLTWARFAAYSAYAINNRNEYTCKNIQELINEQPTIKYSSSKPISVLVVEEMLNEIEPA